MTRARRRSAPRTSPLFGGTVRVVPAEVRRPPTNNATAWTPPRPRRSMRVRCGVVAVVVLLVVGVAGVAVVRALSHGDERGGRRAHLEYATFLRLAAANDVRRIQYHRSGIIVGSFARGYAEHGRSEFVTRGPTSSLPTGDVVMLAQHNVRFDEPASVETTVSWQWRFLLFTLALVPV